MIGKEKEPIRLPLLGTARMFNAQVHVKSLRNLHFITRNDTVPFDKKSRAVVELEMYKHGLAVIIFYKFKVNHGAAKATRNFHAALGQVPLVNEQ
ncbi:hypothetical protein M514_02226 [Trichuris suis]|uniref:Uncharacterized protein n=1 Tax=Trichuris suis TaxID=68888 RepID=A0A085MIC3_9BILA|nr:hypothetical protein M513_02226 [Trichuris suis]KFD70074.1 hypothetical protein M514_02226 [Trichuris suis]